jgi:hypothetical protein
MAIETMAAIRDRIEAVRRRIAAACLRAGREPSEVVLVAVTKTVSPAEIKVAYDAGIRCFGENRVQEAAAKISSAFLPNGENVTAPWHLIGHLQTNKAKKALELFQVIQSLDSSHLAETLQRHAAALGRRLEVFIEVNTSGETAKFGVSPDQAVEFAKKVAELPNLQLTGLMTISALTDDEAAVRRCFRQLRKLHAEVSAANLPGVALRHLSMGMTDDFEMAIEEGSTMVRIGRAIFGERT